MVFYFMMVFCSIYPVILAVDFSVGLLENLYALFEFMSHTEEHSARCVISYVSKLIVTYSQQKYVW